MNTLNYKIAVVDDVPADIEYLETLVKIWAQRAGANVQLSCFSSAEAFLFRYESEKDFDILLLDIEMGGMDGVTMARRVREGNESVQIVFITGYTDYIAEGYEVQALHYLVKPVDGEKLGTVLDRAQEKLRKNERMLTLKTAEGTVRVPLFEIRWIEVLANYVTVHAKEDYTTKRTLGDIERELDERFFRIGRSFIVNLSCIRKVTRSQVHLSSGQILPLPRAQYEKLNRALIERM